MASGLRRPCDAHKQTVIMRLPRERRRIRIASYSVGYELSDVEIKSIATSMSRRVTDGSDSADPEPAMIRRPVLSSEGLLLKTCPAIESISLKRGS